MKLYIAIKDSVPLGIAINSVAHASLIAHLKFSEHEAYKSWLASSFKKVVGKVNEKEFAKLKQLDNTVVITESALEGAEVGVVVCPREVVPNVLKFMHLYK